MERGVSSGRDFLKLVSQYSFPLHEKTSMFYNAEKKRPEPMDVLYPYTLEGSGVSILIGL